MALKLALTGLSDAATMVAATTICITNKTLCVKFSSRSCPRTVTTAEGRIPEVNRS